jgi:hypothetical protein
MIEIRVSTQEEYDAVVSAMQNGSLGEVLTGRGYTVCAERDGRWAQVAEHGRAITTWSGPRGAGMISHGGGGGGGIVAVGGGGDASWTEAHRQEVRDRRL